MSDSSDLEPQTLRTLLDDAIKKYENQVGTSLIENQVAIELGSCDSIESITQVLEERTQAFRKFLGRDRHPKMIKSIKRAVHVLHTIVTGSNVPGGGAVQVGHGAGSVSFPPVKLLLSAIGILLTNVKDVNASYDALLNLFESISNFVERLGIYTKIPLTPVMKKMVVKIIVELLSILAVATKEIKQGPLKKFGMKLLGDNEVEAVLQKLSRLTDDEVRATAAQTLEVVYLLVRNVTTVMDDGEALRDSMGQVLEKIQEMTNQMKKAKCERLRKDLWAWLSPPDPSKNHNTARDDHLTGTAMWFIRDTGTFADWKRSGCLLWLRGNRQDLLPLSLDAVIDGLCFCWKRN